MDIKRLQDEIKGMFDKSSKFKKHTKEGIMTHIVEELGEVSRQLINEKYRKGKFDKKKLAEEIGDVLILINYLSSEYNIDLSKEMESKLKRLNKKINSK